MFSKADALSECPGSRHPCLAPHPAAAPPLSCHQRAARCVPFLPSPSASGSRGLGSPGAELVAWHGGAHRVAPSLGTTTLAASLQWSVSYPDHLCSAPVILCQVSHQLPFFFFSRSPCPVHAFWLARGGFLDFTLYHPNKPCATFSLSCLSSPECHCALSSHPALSPPLPFGRFSLEETSSERCGRVSRGRWQPSLGQGWGGRLILISLEALYQSGLSFCPALANLAV